MSQSAITVVLDPSNRALVMRRSKTDPWKPFHWDLPGGGVDPGESVRDAAVRELWEEAGVQAMPKWAFSYLRPGGLTHVFFIKLNHRPPVVMDHEHDRFKWAPLAAFPQPAIPGMLFVVGQLLRAQTNLAPLDVGNIFLPSVHSR